jgi:hypothetical protein
MYNAEEKRNKELAKTRSKWHASTKGILVRRYRVPSKAQGRKLLQAISSLLAEDDTFRDVATHKVRSMCFSIFSSVRKLSFCNDVLYVFLIKPYFWLDTSEKAFTLRGPTRLRKLTWLTANRLLAILCH